MFLKLPNRRKHFLSQIDLNQSDKELYNILTKQLTAAESADNSLVSIDGTALSIDEAIKQYQSALAEQSAIDTTRYEEDKKLVAQNVSDALAKTNEQIDLMTQQLTAAETANATAIAAEAARGNEFNAWSTGNPPMHETILPFTRLLGGPMDYTPGIFEIKMSYYDKTKTEQVHTTLAKQLALYVTMYSPLQMAADLPENYERYPDAFQFIKEVALDCEESKYIEAEPGDYLTVARKTKGKETWFLGAITDENARKSEIKLDFLSKGKKYKAIISEAENDTYGRRHWKVHNEAI